MKKILNIFALALIVQCTSSVSYAANKASIIRNIDERFKTASEYFANNESGEIKALNGGNNTDITDAPKQDEAAGFIKPSNGTSEMICYKSDTGKIKAANSPNLLGQDFDLELAKKINEKIKIEADGKVEILYSKETKDPNDAAKTLTEPMMAIAWSGFVLTGKKDSTLVCVIKASVPAAA